jgi:hypothetical protein
LPATSSLWAPVYAATPPPPPPPDPTGWWDSYNPNEPQYNQAAGWTCSACALAWLERATQVNILADEWSAVAEIGYPHNINSTYGLMDGSGAQLQRVMREYGIDSRHAWLDFDTAYDTYRQVPGMLSGAAWYHWVGVRGVTRDGLIWIANSAPGYKSVGDTLNRQQWASLGSMSCVWLIR